VLGLGFSVQSTVHDFDEILCAIYLAFLAGPLSRPFNGPRHAPVPICAAADVKSGCAVMQWFIQGLQLMSFKLLIESSVGNIVLVVAVETVFNFILRCLAAE